MLNKKLILSLCFFIVLTITSCKDTVVETEETEKTPEIAATASPSVGLSMEQKLQDFEYMYNILKENYPFFWVNQRVYGDDWLATKDVYIKQIRETLTDLGFENTLNNILKELHNGHTEVYSDDAYKNSYKYYELYKIPINPWLDTLKNPTSLKRYNHTFDNSSSSSSPGPGPQRFTTDIIVPNQVAYLKVKSFSGTSAESDRKDIHGFMDKVKDYPTLIVDIRHNGGGSEQYWMNNIVAPLIKNELSTEAYFIFRCGAYSQTFANAIGMPLYPLSDLDPQLLKQFPPEVIDNFKYYWKRTLAVNPMNSINFNGKVYLLVDKGVYSSAESFAVFCKSTKWATIIGEKTGGDGIGTTPLIVSLPNSGYIVRFPWVMGLTPDGSCNDEKKTEPDIKVDATIGSTYKEDKAIQEVIKLNNLALP